MTTTYSGPALIIGPDFEIPVEADLTGYTDVVDTGRGGMVTGLQSWGGTLEAEGDTDELWKVTHSGGSLYTLRLEDGREGQFIATDSAIGSAVLGITGSTPLGG
jgi:hypothetical protein